jgi:hypothetical protein
MSSSTHDLKNEPIKVSSDGNTFAHANRAKVVSVAVVRDKKNLFVASNYKAAESVNDIRSFPRLFEGSFVVGREN